MCSGGGGVTIAEETVPVTVVQTGDFSPTREKIDFLKLNLCFTVCDTAVYIERRCILINAYICFGN